MATLPSSLPPSSFSKLAKESLPRTTSRNLGEAEIPYLIYDADGPPLMFLHATGFLPWLWHPLAREISPPYQVVAPYFCDHRETSPDDGGLSWLLLAQDLAAFYNTLDLEPPFLVGHSMGATIMTIANSRFGLNARGMILIEPIFLPQDYYGLRITVEQHPLASKSIKRKNYWNSQEEAGTYVRSRPLFKNWDEEMMDLYIKYGMKPGESGGLQLACSPQRETALFMGGMQYDPWPDLSKVTCPVLVLEGERSENRHFIDLRKATSLFPKGTHQVIQGAGHLVPMEKPREVVSIIKTFFDSI
ncbi:MAG: alpha/beta hydrolase [Syntrophales bacterium]|nr:alpha/beta hydrolase [Syntrophales bacterium]MCK9391976.1 alpha/beta hydrolase [Syntrophales bacterium]